MKFVGIRRFVGGTVTDIGNFLTQQFNPGIIDLFNGLFNLDLLDNFQSFKWSGTIVAGATVSLKNHLETIPRYWIVVDANGGNQIIRGATPWTVSFLNLKNYGSNDSTITVLFFR
jgi:hypothetical protein